MVLRVGLSILSLSLLAAACSREEAPAPEPAAPTAPNVTLYTGASIWTGNDAAPRAEAMAVAEGRILAIGGEAAVRTEAGDVAKIVDLGGGFVMPGFIDNHTHFLYGGFGLSSVKLRDAASPEEFSKRIADFAASQPEGRWILNGDWDHELWGGELPHKDWIDDATAHHPVFVSRLDGHMALANSAAIALAGVTAETPDPDGGEIVRDENGELTGVFKDTAMDLIGAAMPPRSDEEYDEALAAASAHALSLGVTQVHDMGAASFDGRWEDFSTFRRAHERDDLNLRVYSFLPLKDWDLARALVGEIGRGDDMLRWGALKGFVDGSLGSTTAWFYEPYDDAPETNGFAVGDLDEVKRWIKGAHGAGLHVAVHAIGDQANDWLLDVYEEALGEDRVWKGPGAGQRFRIEHAQHLSPQAIDRFAALGVIPSMQPYHAIDDGRWAEKRIGADRIKRTYAFKSLLTAGAPLTFGSDWFVAPLSPLEGIYAAVTRRTFDGANPEGWVPEQKITVEEAMRAYTAANAYAGYQEDVLGSLEPGKLADFVVLSADLTAIDPAAIPEVQVLRTYIGGEEKFRAE